MANGSSCLRIVMLGPDLRARGGIAACARLLLHQMKVTPNVAHIDYVALAPRLRTAQREKATTAAKGYIHFVRALCRKPDLIHIHTSRSGDFWRNAPALLLCRIARRPVILHVHPANAFAESLQGGAAWVARARLWLIGVAALILVPSEEGARALREADLPVQVETLANPIKTDEYLRYRREHRDVAVTYLGWLIPEKGVDDLVHVLPALASSYKGFSASLYGPYGADRIRCLVDDLGLVGVTVGEWIDGRDKLDLLGRSRVVALPSYSEGLPVVLLEAMASGTPVVSTPVGGVPEAVPDGEAGLLILPGDRSALKAALHTLLSDGELWQRMSSRAHELSRQYDVENVIGKLLQYYSSVLGPVDEEAASVAHRTNGECT